MQQTPHHDLIEIPGLDGSGALGTPPGAPFQFRRKEGIQMKLQGGQSRRRGSAGFTLIEIMIVVAIIGILLAIAVPGWMRYRYVSQARVCQENLRIIDEAKEQLALVEGLSGGTVVEWDQLYVAGDRGKCYLDHGIPACPASGDYILNPISTLPECSVGRLDLMGGADSAQHRLAGQVLTSSSEQ